jgi:hypothetical protein
MISYLGRLKTQASARAVTSFWPPIRTMLCEVLSWKDPEAAQADILRDGKV